MLRKTPYFIVAFLAIILLSGAFSLVGSPQKEKEKKKEETYTRPAPTKPISAEIPSANKYQEDKVFLENADSLFRPEGEIEEKQVVKGNVKFRQGAMWMFCDSAYYYPQQNSMDAFGHVEMRQGDTLFVYADKLFYDGGARHAILTSGPTRSQVEMKDPQMTLTTDSLDYDLNMDLGWYAVGGKLDDGVNQLTSVYGQYSPGTKLSEFRDNVILVNNRDGYKMFTEELFYNTNTNVAEIKTETKIEGKNDTILTTSGWYDTRTDNAHLTSRSTILHKDSAGNVVTLEGDSIIYDKLKHLSEAFMFRNPNRHPRPMVLTDTARKMTLIGGYGLYNDSLQESMSTYYPLLMEYSTTDTIFMRADTILTFMRVEKVWPDSLNNNWDAATRTRLRAFKSWTEMADSMPLTLLTLPWDFQKPGFGLPKPTANDEEGEENSEIEEVDISEPGLEDQLELVEADTIQDISPELERLPEEEFPIEPEVPDKMMALVEEMEDVVELPEDTVPPGPRLDALGRDSAFMIDKQFNAAKAIGKARFFRSDIQGIADTLLYHQYDSMLYMLRRPVVWSGERQVFGDTIKVHFRDSVADWAHLPVGGMVIEHIDEEFYNQLSGSDIKAFLKDNSLERLEVSGNVETIFLPMDNDSTYSRLVHAEGSYLTVEMSGKEMKKLKLWPEPDGTLTPLFLVKRNDEKYLRGFKWLEMLRPRREWYGESVKWADELGEVPDELIEYFK